MDKQKPRCDVLKDLMRRTYACRWDAFTNKGEPKSLFEYIEMYPLLKKNTYVSCTITINDVHIRACDGACVIITWMHGIFYCL